MIGHKRTKENDNTFNDDEPKAKRPREDNDDRCHSTSNTKTQVPIHQIHAKSQRETVNNYIQTQDIIKLEKMLTNENPNMTIHDSQPPSSNVFYSNLPKNPWNDAHFVGDKQNKKPVPLIAKSHSICITSQPPLEDAPDCHFVGNTQIKKKTLVASTEQQSNHNNTSNIITQVILC